MRKIVFLVIAYLAIGLAATAQVNGQRSMADGQRQYDVLFHEAMLRLQKGELDAAYDLLERCRQTDGQRAEAYYYLGQLYAEMEHDSLAMDHFKRACLLEPRNATLMERLAGAYLQQDQYAEAAEVLERLYQTNKGRVDLFETLYPLYMQLKDYDHALDVLNRMETADGPTERTTLMKCRIYIEQNDADHAISEMKRLAEHYPNDPTYRTLYANTLIVTDHTDEAYGVLQQVLGEAPQNLRAQQVLRNSYIRQGEEEKADSVNHAILINPKASVEDKVEQLRAIIIENEQQGGDSTDVLTLFDELLAQPSPNADNAAMKA